MPHSIFLQDLVNHLITEMSTSICDQCSWSAEPCKYMAAKELGYHTCKTREIPNSGKRAKS